MMFKRVVEKLKSSDRSKREYSFNFNAPIRQRKEWHGGPVTRDHFCSIILHSFIASRGKIIRQLLFLEWVRLNNGWDWRNTLKELRRSGGLRQLSDEEIDKLYKTFHSGSLHKGYRKRRNQDRHIFIESVERELYKLLNYSYGKHVIENHFQSVAAFQTLTLRELKKRLLEIAQ